MPVDKFGRHLHQHPKDQAKVYVAEDVTRFIETLRTDLMTAVKTEVASLKYDTIFYLMALNADSKGRYRLLNGSANLEYIYKLPTATIKNITCTPEDCKIYINGVERPKSALVGLTLTEGDKIHVMHKTYSRHILACEFVLQVSVRPNQI